MADIATLWDVTRGDWKLVGADLVDGEDIVTAVLISLFTDRQANTDDVIPDGSNDPRGWWGNLGEPFIGSRLWLLTRAKRTQQTLGRAQSYIQEALQWLIDDAVAARLDVDVEWTQQSTLAARVTVYRPSSSTPIVVNREVTL